MGLDINKIIEESVQDFEETTGVAKEAIENLNESQEVEVNLEEQEEVNNISNTQSSLEIFESAIMPSIAAGMGAVSLRKRIRDLNESGGQIMEADEEAIGDAAAGVLGKAKELGEDGLQKVTAASKAIKKAVGDVDDKVKIPVAAALGGTVGAAAGYKLGKKKKLQEDQELMEISDKWKSRLKTGAKVGAGAAALGGAAMAAHAAMKGDDDAKPVSNTMNAHSDDAAWGKPKAPKVSAMGGRDAEGVGDNAGSKSTMTAGEKSSRSGGAAILKQAKDEEAAKKAKIAGKMTNREAESRANTKNMMTPDKEDAADKMARLNKSKALKTASEKVAEKMHFGGR